MDLFCKMTVRSIVPRSDTRLIRKRYEFDCRVPASATFGEVTMAARNVCDVEAGEKIISVNAEVLCVATTEHDEYPQLCNPFFAMMSPVYPTSVVDSPIS